MGAKPNYCLGYKKAPITTLQVTPCQRVFGRDMIHNIAVKANWDRIQKRKQDIINKSNKKENKSQNELLRGRPLDEFIKEPHIHSNT